MHAMLDKVRRGLVAGVERHERRCRIDSLTACGGSTIKIKNYNRTKSEENLSTKRDDSEKEGDTEGMHELLRHRDWELTLCGKSPDSPTIKSQDDCPQARNLRVLLSITIRIQQDTVPITEGLERANGR